jgi:Caspase domain
MTQSSSASFEHGYALLIGVDDNQVARLQLLDVAKDINAIKEVLTHQERCAYPADHVKVIQGKEATRTGILDGIEWLREQIANDPDATAILYYSGHGFQDEEVEPTAYYLIPYDMVENQFERRGLAAQDLAKDIASLKPKRLLVILDCCHAAGMEIKNVSTSGNYSVAVPAKLFRDPNAASKSAEQFGNSGASSKGFEQLQKGHGRAVLSSSQGSESSYMRMDGKMSVFTYHLIEALTGHAQPEGGAKEVLVSDLLSHVYRTVPESAAAMQRAQNPEFEVSGNFPVALLIGGKGVAKGEAAPDPLEALPAVTPTQQAINTGSGGLAQGDGAVAAGQDGIAIGGDATGATIMTGNRNRVEQVNTGGGTYIRGNLNNRGDFVGRDKVTHGDTIHGDKIGGDKVQGDKFTGDKIMGNKNEGDQISVGNISGSSGIAIGRGAQAKVNSGVQSSDLTDLFAIIYGQIDAHSGDPSDREEVRQNVQRIEQEVGKGDAANQDRLKRWLTAVKDLAPDIFSALIRTLLNPATRLSAGIAGVIKTL